MKIEYKVHIDKENGVSGITYPTGTLLRPVNNLSDATKIAMTFDKYEMMVDLSIYGFIWESGQWKRDDHVVYPGFLVNDKDSMDITSKDVLTYVKDDHYDIIIRDNPDKVLEYIKNEHREKELRNLLD